MVAFRMGGPGKLQSFQRINWNISWHAIRSKEWIIPTGTVDAGITTTGNIHCQGGLEGSDILRGVYNLIAHACLVELRGIEAGVEVLISKPSPETKLPNLQPTFKPRMSSNRVYTDMRRQ